INNINTNIVCGLRRSGRFAIQLRNTHLLLNLIHKHKRTIARFCTMGKGRYLPLKVDKVRHLKKRVPKVDPCVVEMQALITCMASNAMNDKQCTTETAAYLHCSRQKNVRPQTIRDLNYKLRKLNTPK
ncbi:hypothetical protein SARC_08222, partial [Sphaeroforma arctica JP610]